MKNEIKIRGAKQHNLKNVNLDLPKNNLIVFTGVSGSGKSSLAFDTIYAEGQRRYVESLSTYARQFLGVMEKPEVDLIEGLSPSISIDQKTTSKNPRSTVGTVTEIYDYLRLLYAKIGHPHCPLCGREISRQTVDQIVESAMGTIKLNQNRSLPSWYLILSPVVNDKKGEFSALFSNLKAKGYQKIRIDGNFRSLQEEIVLIKTNRHTIEVVIDQIAVDNNIFRNKLGRENIISRLTEATENALKLSDGLVILAKILDQTLEIPEYPKKTKDTLFSERFACPSDNIQLTKIEPRSFSFNSPHGACPECNGLGSILMIEPSLIISNQLSIKEGGILPFSNMFEHDTWYSRLMLIVCEKQGIDPSLPLFKLKKDQLDTILYGTGEVVYTVKGTNRWGKSTQIYKTFDGVVNELTRRHQETTSDYIRNEVEKYMREHLCETCKGKRLKSEALSVTINQWSIADVTALSIEEAAEWFNHLRNKNVISEIEIQISHLIIKEIIERLKFLTSVGLNYITLERSAGSLSGGEAQRIRLASQIGSGLTGVLYVLDEPTIGLHQRDNQKLIITLKRLKNIGNTVIVVEHDREMIESADHLVDFGPKAGHEGGQIVFQGSPESIKKAPQTLTGQYLANKKTIRTQVAENVLNLDTKKEKYISIKGCSQYNLKNIDVKFPLEKLVCITGVSGSGKSTLLVETLYRTLMLEFNPMYKEIVGVHQKLSGIENVDKVILIDQAPIGKTPRSNPATYTQVFNHIREAFAGTREAKAEGYNKSRFSFNLKEGRCDNCDGQGQIKIEMQFMSDVWIKCDVCDGKRYNKATLDVSYRGKNIAEVLEMSVDEALDFFHGNPKIISILETLQSVGLDYIKLGQSATTLSGGEAQRVKLSTELSKKSTGKTVYILDEPTTGLHFYDVQKLLNVLRLLVNRGNSVFIIEHNLDIIKNSDWIIDLGPEGGEAGGKLIYEGPVEKIKMTKVSYTGQYL